MEIIVLAGGLGSRLRTVISQVPKPMAPVNGRPFLEHLMDYWITQGISRAILSVGYKADLIIGHFGAYYRGIALDYAVEVSPCGTGGGLLLAVERMKESGPALVVNGDTFFEVDLTDMVGLHHARGADLTMALVKRHDPDRYQPVGLDKDGRIMLLRGQGLDGCFVNGGVYLLEPHLLKEQRWVKGMVLSLERDMLPKWIEDGKRIFGYAGEGRFVDIGVPVDYAAAGALIGEREYGWGTRPQT